MPAATNTDHEAAALRSVPQAALKELTARAARLQIERDAIVRDFAQGFRRISPERRDPCDAADAIRRLAHVFSERRNVRARLAAVGVPAPDEDLAGETWDLLGSTERGGHLRSFASARLNELVRLTLKNRAEAEAASLTIRAAVERSDEPAAPDPREAEIEGLMRQLRAEPWRLDVNEKIKQSQAEMSRPAPGLEANRKALVSAHKALVDAALDLATLRYDPEAAVKLAAAAVEAAGGPQGLATAIRSALQASDRHESATAAHGEARGHDDRAAAIDAQLKRITDKSSTLAVALAARLKEAKSQAKAAAARIGDQAEAALEALVSAASKGEPGAVDRVARIAREVPDAFVPGFASAWATPKPDEDQMRGAIAVTLAKLMQSK